MILVMLGVCEGDVEKVVGVLRGMITPLVASGASNCNSNYEKEVKQVHEATGNYFQDFLKDSLILLMLRYSEGDVEKCLGVLRGIKEAMPASAASTCNSNYEKELKQIHQATGNFFKATGNSH